MNIMQFYRKLILVALLSCTFAQPIGAKQALDRIVAVVNNDVISQSELDKYLKMVTIDMGLSSGSLPPKSVLQQQVLNRMILDRAQLQLAEQLGIEVDSFAVSQTLQHLANQQHTSLENYKKHIEAKGIKFDEYRELVKKDLIIQSLQDREVNQDISVTKTEIENYLSSPAGQDQSGTEYKLSHILILTPETPTPEALKKVQDQAQELVTKLKNGADFNQVAMSKSAGRQALKGGDLGWRTSGELPTVFVPYVPPMQVGEVVGPIRSTSGFHIIKLQEKRIPSEAARTETQVRQILIKSDTNTSSEEARAILADIHKQLNAGADFAKLAQQKSQERRSAEKGGDMGWVTEKTILPKFYQTMVKLRNNEISEPFMTEEGWHLIQVLNRRTQLTSSEATWNKAREIIATRKTNEALEAWMKRVRDESRVEVLLADDSNKTS